MTDTLFVPATGTYNPNTIIIPKEHIMVQKVIEVVGVSIKDAKINFGPGATGKKMSEMSS